jgi:hypothetical protein
VENVTKYRKLEEAIMEKTSDVVVSCLAQVFTIHFAVGIALWKGDVLHFIRTPMESEAHLSE